ncbi:MAG TPA: Spy/CpxP family protein refolding chaperone [Thermoanaerobaculia bacterium]|nr:Spy/CpxP family protein refolding chaperone [Thermoanaerobaculia bacterium]
MKRISISILIVISIAAAAIAAPRRNEGPGGPPPMGGRGPEMSPQQLADFLDLTDAQISAAQALHATLQSTVEPLHATLETNREQLEAAVKAGDAAKAGTLAIANYRTMQQIKAARDAFKSGFEALLNADQKAKFAVLAELREARHDRGPRG